MRITLNCHTSEGWYPASRLSIVKRWMPAFAGMTMVGLVFTATNALATDMVPVRDSTVSVVGISVIKLTPDQITVPVTISTADVDLSKAKEINDKKVKKILVLAEKYGVGKDDVSTTYHSVEPQMSYANNVNVEVEVFTASINYNIDVRGLAEDKIDALVEALQKADLTSVNLNKTQGVTMIYASFNASNEKQEMVRDKIKTNQDAVTKIVTAAGIARDKIGVNTNNGKGKENRSQTNKPHVEKYKAVVALNVVMKEKDKAVDFVNAALKEGVENVGSISFSLKDEKTAQDKASLEALKDAKRKAQAIAEAMGVVIDKPLSISADGAQVMPIQPYAMMRARAFDGQIDNTNLMKADKMKSITDGGALPTGQIEIRSSVNATFLLKQK